MGGGRGGRGGEARQLSRPSVHQLAGALSGGLPAPLPPVQPREGKGLPCQQLEMGPHGPQAPRRGDSGPAPYQAG